MDVALSSAALRQQIDSVMRGTSGQYKISKTDIQRLEIPKMSLDEQRRIVAVHAAFERRIGALDRVLSKLAKAKVAAFSRALFPYMASNLVQLKALLKCVQSGWSPACDSFPPAQDEWGVIRVSAVTSGRFDARESKRLPSALKPRPELVIRQGDVLVARANGARSLVGSVCHVDATPGNLMLSDKTLRLVPDSAAVEPVFLALLLASESVRMQIGNLLNGGTGQNNITQDDIRGLRVPMVSVEDQCRIIEDQALFERRRVAVEAQIAKLRVIQSGLLEDLFGGRGWALSARLESIPDGPACPAFHFEYERA
ncbi:hypothetical protein [Streptomyces atroolivaceus]|uniref:hypothetical protein n=1 Tax=Streptomyces atroolivaceus TaxID=66869 RepID=UPI002023F14B|nr:hypothetical protein [Streptomyces atroolivaceus]